MNKLFSDATVSKMHKALGIEKQEVLNEYACENCKRVVQEIKNIYNDGRESVRVVGCLCEDMKKNAQFLNAQKIKEYERFSIMPDDYKNKRVNQYAPQNNSQHNAKEVVISFLKNYKAAIEKGQGILFKGSFGTGKTHLASSIGNYLRSQKLKVLFITFSDYIENIKGGFNSKYGDTRMQDLANKTEDMARKADVLILDDVGTVQMTDWQKRMWTTLINVRKGKTTIITTNLTDEQLLRDDDLHRSYSRMLEENKLVEIDGSDYRKNDTFIF